MQSSRQTVQRRNGGQPGHRGQTLEMIRPPDEVIEHAVPQVCGQCGDGMQAEPVSGVLKRQVFDIPAPLQQVRHPRQSRWLDEWDRPKGGCPC